jgi:hypothetical protein
MTDTFAENAKDSDAAVIARGLSEAVPWMPFKKGETALDFGRQYMFIATKTVPIQYGIMLSMQAPAEADYCCPVDDFWRCMLPAHVQLLTRAELEKQHGQE